MRVHCVISAQTFPYFEYCVKNHLSMADSPDSIEFVPYCLDQASYDRVRIVGYQAHRLPDSSGSTGHMHGIRKMLTNLAGHDINVIADTDCVVLLKGWDTKLAELMQTYDAVGSTYEDLGGFSSGSGTAQTYKKIPNFSWCALSNRHTWDFDVSVDKANLLPILTEEDSRTFNLPIGYSLFREPCWKFPVYVRENGVKCYPLDFVRPTSGNAKAITTNEDYHTEYTLSDGTPYVAHQRGSMSKAFRVHPLSKTFYDAVDAYIARTNA